MIPHPIKRWLQTPLESLFGSADAWLQHRTVLKRRPTIRQAIDTIQHRWQLAPGDDDDDPIMIFSAGWRSGSTLLQRLVLSGSDALIWGEPYPYCDYIRSLARSLTAFTDATPPDQFFLPEPPGTNDIDLASWTACLYPQPVHLIQAHRAFFRQLYSAPAKARGYTRWGLKEVVLSTDDAAYLNWLFPRGRFVFLHRNPYDAYRSYRTFGDWYYRWPDHPVFTAQSFGRVWRTLVQDHLANFRIVDGLIVRFDELHSGSPTLGVLAQYLGTRVRPDIADIQVTGRTSGALAPIPRLELWQLQRQVEPLARQLGYFP